MIKKIGQHLSNWPEVYLWGPISLFSILAARWAIAVATGHDPKENVDWLQDYSALLVKTVFIIVSTSVMKQATGTWFTKQEKLASPTNAAISAFATLAVFYGWIYFWTH